VRYRPLTKLGRPATIADVLSRRADRDPDGTAYVFTDDAVSDVRISYAELDAKARAVSHLLLSRGAFRSRIVLAMPPGIPFVSAFFGALYARGAAVPVALPRSFEPKSDAERERLARILRDCRPAALLTTLALAPFIEAALIALMGGEAPPVLAVDAIDPAPSGHSRLRGRPGDVAVIQYTSGSTGDPRGVMVKHDNIMANQSMIIDAYGHDETTILGGWLPHYHDMGLFGLLLHPLYLGTPAIAMPTLSFAQRPYLWPKMISRYRVTSSGGPSFAYELTARRTTDAQLEGLDLSCWRIASDGSEPVRAEAHRRFAARFAKVGFDASAFVPSYGLAEATLIVTGGPARGTPPRTLRLDGDALGGGRAEQSCEPDAIEIVSCGRGHAGQSLRIVDPDRRTPVPEGCVGEIWIEGPHVAKGYFGRPELSRETFGATLGREGPFLRSGDLGFLEGGELFVTGRRKDLIIVLGKNHYPHDLEETFANALGVPERRVVALADESREGALVVIVELSREEPPPDDHALRDARRAVFRSHGLAVSEALVVPAGAIPRTSSGKKQRSRMRQLLADGSFVSRSERSAS
jgi:acyl-CoA synthetase (AMP-forming)/AMP-acid ligase II